MKKVLSLMMTLVMMFGLVSVAATEAQAAEHKHCICGGKAAGVGDHTACADVTYTELTADLVKSALPEGNYYLTADLQLEGQITFAENAKVNICLNGFKLKGASDSKTGSVIMVNKGGVKLSITDCKGTGVLEGNAAKAGSCMYLNGTAVVVNLFGGTCAYNTTACAAQGANVVVNNDGTVFNMYGGTIKDGATTAPLAGNVQVKKGAMNMYGGSILNGQAKSNAGNVEVRDPGVLTIYNGTISGGKVTTPEVEGDTTNSDIFAQGALVIKNMEESFYLRGNSSWVDKIDLTNMDSSLSLSGKLKEDDGTRKNVLVTKTKASTGTQTGGTTTGGTTTGGTTTGGSTSNTPATGDMANPVIVALVMVVAVAGMVYFVPKKRRA